jgi:hypothetical protein
MVYRSGYTQLRRKRILVGAIGVLLGWCVGIPVTYWVNGRYFDFLTLAFGCLGGAVALRFAEKKIRLATTAQLRDLSSREKLNVLGLSTSDEAAEKEEKGRPNVGGSR